MIWLLHRDRTAQWVAHLGGEELLTTPERDRIDDAVRLWLIERLAWTRAYEEGLFAPDGSELPALAAFLKYSRERREVEERLGTKRREHTVTIQEVFDRIAAQREPPAEKEPGE